VTPVCPRCGGMGFHRANDKSAAMVYCDPCRNGVKWENCRECGGIGWQSGVADKCDWCRGKGVVPSVSALRRALDTEVGEVGAA